MWKIAPNFCCLLRTPELYICIQNLKTEKRPLYYVKSSLSKLIWKRVKRSWPKQSPASKSAKAPTHNVYRFTPESRRWATKRQQPFYVYELNSKNWKPQKKPSKVKGNKLKSSMLASQLPRMSSPSSREEPPSPPLWSPSRLHVH